MSYRFKNVTPGWQSGEWLGVCMVCGFKKRSSELFRRWDGLRVCAEDLEARHPQEFIKARVDERKVAFTRPETTEREVGIAVNCTTATFREYSREEISTISSIVKARVPGPVDISGTLSVLCELEVY